MASSTMTLRSGKTLASLNNVMLKKKLGKLHVLLHKLTLNNVILGKKLEKLHVLLHELTHSTVKEYTHSDAFWKNFTELCALHDSLLEEWVKPDSGRDTATGCFGTDGWPSLEEARAKSIATDETYEFDAFCRNELFKVKNSDAYAKRLCTLAVAESLMRSGPRVLKMHQTLLVLLYDKLLRAHHSVTPPDMREYLDRLRSFQYSSVSPCVE